MTMRHEAGPAKFCVTNAKGGTGKTTVAINVAGALNERGRDVLLIDLDPQGNATEGLGLLDAYDETPPTFFDALTDARFDGATALVVEHDEMDVLPSNVDLLQAEHELTIADLMARVAHDPDIEVDPGALAPLAINATPDLLEAPHALDLLDRAIDDLATAYDYVVIDSPPFYGNLTNAGIYAARHILIPALAESTSERAIELLIDQVAALERDADIAVEPLGVVANRVENTGEDEAMLAWFNEVFADRPVWEVRKRVALQRAFSAGQSVFAYDAEVDMTRVFLDIAAQLDQRFGFTEPT